LGSQLGQGTAIQDVFGVEPVPVDLAVTTRCMRWSQDDPVLAGQSCDEFAFDSVASGDLSERQFLLHIQGGQFSGSAGECWQRLSVNFGNA
jgi:hypothetical protein